MLGEVEIPRAQHLRPQVSGAQVSGAQVSGAQQPSPVAGPAPRGQRRRTADFMGGVFAMLLLPLSIFPVLLLGPSVLRAPVTLAHEAWGDVQRLEQDLQPAHVRHHGIAASELRKLPLVSLGPVYGRWLTFPQTGRLRPGNPLLGPEDQTE